MTTNGNTGSSPSQVDLAILRTVERFHYLTAAQVNRLFYNCHDGNRYARRRLARLAQAKLLLRLSPLPTPRHGSAPHVFTLARAGRDLLATQETYYRPAEERTKGQNHSFMDHTLAAIDVLISAEILCRTRPVTMPRLLTERALRRSPSRVSLPGTDGRPERSVAVIPDAWFELSVEPELEVPSAIALELDRSTEDQRHWRAKVHALALWASDPYPKAFGTRTLTIAVVTPDSVRRDTLRVWTDRELVRLGMQGLSNIFLFTSADPVRTPPADLFSGQVWFGPAAAEPVSLLPPLPTPAATGVRAVAGEVWRYE